MNALEEKINALTRPGIRALKPYSSARDEFKGTSPSPAFVFLDANENSLGGPLDEDFSRYPDPHQQRLKALIAARNGVREEQIFLGSGSDEAIDLLLRAFCEPGRDNIILMPPTYGMYAVQAGIQHAEIRAAPLRPDFSPDAAAVKAVTDEHSKLLFLCSPNNPTGQCLPDDFIFEMLDSFPGLVVVDEAYADFSGKPPWVERLAEFPSLVVLKTLSKAWGLAGLRTGMAFSNTFVISTLNKIKYPYNLGTPTIRLVEKALQREPSMRAKVAALLDERARLEAGLAPIACVRKIFPSDANFLLIRVTDADRIYQFLCENGVVVRNRNRDMNCKNCLRITVGTREENERVLHLLRACDTSANDQNNHQHRTMTKVLFIDRDGTIIAEPQPDQQVDSLEKLEFLPGAIFALARIARELDFALVLVTNQDGLGTTSFPENTFWPAQEKMLKTLENEGVVFTSIHIDRSFPHENLPTRKPGTAMLGEYLNGDFDLRNSFVIGDRLTDVRLAKNLGAKAVFLKNLDDPEGHETEIELIAENWEQIYQFLRLPPRQAIHRRTTRETDILVELNLDGSGKSDIRTGLGFFDHMLDQLARHGNLDLTVNARGDLHIDEHHTVEDTALALGEAMTMALGDKRGVERYGFCLPMDDALAQVALDFGGRPWLVWHAEFRREKIGDVPTELFFHFFKSFSDAARCNLNIQCEGQNEHHKIEAIFKAFAKALKMSVKRDPNNRELPTTKGVL